MAITDANRPSKQTDQLNRRFARLAGGGSALVGLLGLVAAIVYLIVARDLPAQLVVGGVLKLVYLALLVVAGVQLFRMQVWAQRVLLVAWLLALLMQVVFVLVTVLWGVPAWWSEMVSFHPASASIPAAVLSGVAVAALIAAADASSRLRYASMVSVAVTAAIAVAAVVNIIAQTDYYRRPIETLGRYRLSERTKKILRDVDRPIVATCVYTGTDEKTRTEYRPRVIELLEEMREIHSKITVDQVTNDDDRVALQARLREHLGGQADRHGQLLQRFVREIPETVKEIEAVRDQWSGPLPYLEAWGQPAVVQDHLKQVAAALTKAVRSAKQQLRGGTLPQYGKLVEDAKAALEAAKGALEARAKRLEQIGKIPAAIRAGRKKALAALDKCLAAMKALPAAVGKPGDPPAADPGAALGKFAAAAAKASKLTVEAARALAGVAGDQNAELLERARAWSQQIVVESQGRRGLIRLSHPQRLLMLAQELGRTSLEAKAFRDRANVETQRQTVSDLREAVQQYLATIAETRKIVEGALTKLSTVGAADAKILDAAAKGDYFAPLLAPIVALLDEAGKLPEIKGDSLAQQIAGEKNFVVLEAGDGKAKTVQIVGFDAVWPLKVRRPAATGDQEGERQRIFNGDSAIGSTLLKMTHQPFATVLIAYAPSAPAHPMFGGGNPFGRERYAALVDQLEKANFKVTDWDLNQPMPTVAEGDPPPVLLVLPPSEPSRMPTRPGQPPQPSGFTPMHAGLIQQAVDDGTPAIFLTSYIQPRVQRNPMTGGIMTMPRPYPLAPYLRDQWGIDVRTDYRIIAAIVDPDEPGKFKIDPIRINWMPLSHFTDQPIGRPLQGLRMVWSSLCPVAEAETVPDDVEVEPLLTVPANETATWATRRFQQLVEQFSESRDSQVSPDYEVGDIAVPFDVAVAAIRSEADDRPGARIIVLPMAASFLDGYLDGEVPSLAGGGLTMTDPPRANADVAVNSVYWLIGKTDWIASGPVRVKPVALISPTASVVLWVLCVICIPLVVLAIGGTVMLLRRR